jgi:mono/diheme cytochrome c family protein
MLRPTLIAVTVLALAIPAAVMGQAPGGPSFTAAQADRGASAYSQSCAMCHAEDMSGGGGIPALSGPEFAFGWKGKPAAALFDHISTRMPPGQEGSLTPQQYLDIMAAILRKNGAAPAGAELTPGLAALNMALVVAP